MTEERRKQRNDARLAELHPAFRRRIVRVLADLERRGYRPRIQDAYRTPEAQRAAARRGQSRLAWGFHNAVSASGTPEALAADVLDDDAPLRPSRDYIVALSAAAERHECATGIRWGLPAALRRAVDRAVRSGLVDARLKVGWDPCHVEPGDLTVAQARAGRRPA